LRAPRIRHYVMTYAAHCCELFAVRSWMVAFITHAAPGVSLPAPTIAAVLNLLGPPASIAGNELAGGPRVRMVRPPIAASAGLGAGLRPGGGRGSGCAGLPFTRSPTGRARAGLPAG